MASLMPTQRLTVDLQTISHAMKMLRYSANEGFRRYEAYHQTRSTRLHEARKQARNLYKLARGGAARFVFERAPNTDAGPTSATDRGQRVRNHRTLRKLMERNLEVVGAYTRAEHRARVELRQAHDHAKTLAAIGMFKDFEQQVLAAATDVLRRESTRTTKQRNQVLAHAPTVTTEQRRALAEVKAAKWRLERVAGRGAFYRHALTRPVAGKIVGRFWRVRGQGAQTPVDTQRR